MSRHRKIFNLFKFVDEVASMSNVCLNAKLPLYLKVLEFLSHLGSFFYFIFDNFLWLINSKLLNFFSETQVDRFKYVKDLGSFWRIIFNLVINILYVRQFIRRRKALVKKMLFMKGSPIEKSSEAIKDLQELLEVRFELRNAWIEILHSGVRMMMLWKSLGFPGNRNINPVTGAAIGYVSTLLSLFKTLFDSPQLLVKTIEEDVKEKSERGDLIRSMSSVFNQDSGPAQDPMTPRPSDPHTSEAKQGFKIKAKNLTNSTIMARTFTKRNLGFTTPQL